MNVREYYLNALQERGYQIDPAQQMAIDRLQVYYDDWLHFKKARSGRLRKIFGRPDVPKGVYLWGGVGRGKSFLMDAFYLTVPLKRKTRLHFHEFMRGVHEELRAVKGRSDPLDEVARRIARRYRLICFDEFHVSDIADAMILYRLLLRLFELGTSFVMTSNYEPSTLYPDGLHRDRILPAIDLIYERLDVLNVDAGIDYRRQTLSTVRSFLYPLNDQTREELQASFDRLIDTAPMDTVLDVEQRKLKAVARGGNIVWFDFKTLCGGPRSQNDYLALAERFQIVILSDVPRMGPRHASEARRFTWLIDVFYDHKVKLIMSAECHRTVSRIVEMQSQEYLQAERREIATL